MVQEDRFRQVRFSEPEDQDPGAQRLERRTLDLLSQATASADFIEAEELRFRSSLCLFLSRCELTSLQKVVGAYLRDLSSTDWPEEVKTRPSLAQEIKACYPDTIVPCNEIKDSSQLFTLLWQQWMELAAALDPNATLQEEASPCLDTPTRKLSVKKVSVKNWAQESTKEASLKDEPQEQVLETEAQLNPAEDQPKLSEQVLEDRLASRPTSSLASTLVPGAQVGAAAQQRPLASCIQLDLSQVSNAAATVSRCSRISNTGASLSHRLADPSTFSPQLAPQTPSSARLPTAAHLLTPRQYQLLLFQVMLAGRVRARQAGDHQGSLMRCADDGAGC
jgi:hypothetical protein